MIEGKAETGSLVTGGVAGVFASACCAGPLILVSVGLGGAWVSRLTALTPYRWIFIGIAVAALILAWRRIYRPAAQCEPGQVCAVPRTRPGLPGRILDGGSDRGGLRRVPLCSTFFLVRPK